MIVTAPEVTSDEIRHILDEFAEKGRHIPEPLDVEVAATEDYDGDPILEMTVTFPVGERPEDPSWNTISPLISALRKLVFRKGGESRPVIAEICRLGETAEA